MPTPAISPSDLIAVAAMIFGFGIVVIMFRVQRELWAQETHPKWPLWTSWADWLILWSVPLGCLAILSLLSFPWMRPIMAVAAALCASAVVLQTGYIPAVMAHYRIFFGKRRRADNVPREAGEPSERVLVILTAVVALLVFAFVFRQQR
jgi:hypothetical protein